MRDREGNILLPAAFIEAAERFGLIGSIDRVIVEKTMRLQAELKRPLTFSMNLSGKVLGSGRA
jgi:EAL domain-containing protein (putative c-di-GMP-specific phosphodiesterase class I)